MAWNFCASAAAIAKAGANANTSIIVDVPTLDQWSNEAEGMINAETRRDWITNPPSDQFSGALAEAESSIVANKIIGYDPDRYGIQTAQFMADINKDTAEDAIRKIKEKQVQENM